MRTVDQLLQIIGEGEAPPITITDVSVVPLAAAGMVEPLAHPSPPGANYVARARAKHLLVDTDEMSALRAAGASFDQGLSA
jgi:hypothetical protein